MCALASSAVAAAALASLVVLASSGSLNARQSTPTAAAAGGPGAGACVWVGNAKQLFIDDTLIASALGGVHRVMNPPIKLGRRVLAPTAAWELALNVSYGLYSSVLREERDGVNVTRLWYFAVAGNSSVAEPYSYLQAYAESADGAELVFRCVCVWFMRWGAIIHAMVSAASCSSLGVCLASQRHHSCSGSVPCTTRPIVTHMALCTLTTSTISRVRVLLRAASRHST